MKVNTIPSYNTNFGSNIKDTALLRGIIKTAAYGDIKKSQALYNTLNSVKNDGKSDLFSVNHCGQENDITIKYGKLIKCCNSDDSNYLLDKVISFGKELFGESIINKEVKEFDSIRTVLNNLANKQGFLKYLKNIGAEKIPFHDIFAKEMKSVIQIQKRATSEFCETSLLQLIL